MLDNEKPESKRDILQQLQAQPLTSTALTMDSVGYATSVVLPSSLSVSAQINV
jgi:hypothetical protein